MAGFGERVVPFERAHETVIAIAERCEDLTPAMKRSQEYMLASVRENFERESTPDGIRWPALKPATIRGRFRSRKSYRLKRKRRGRILNKRGEKMVAKALGGGGSVRILFDSGMLSKSVTAAGAPGAIRDVTRRSVTIGSNLPHAATHNFGDAPRGIPQRQYLGFADAHLEDLADIILDWCIEEKS